MGTKFPNIPGTYHTLNDGNLRVERVAPGQKITVLGVTTADIPVNEPIALGDTSTGILSLAHPSNGDLRSVPSELNRGVAEVSKGVDVEYVKIAHGWGEEGFLHIADVDFQGHIITEAERYVALEETFDLLLNHNMDMVYIPGIYVDRTATLSGVYDADGTTSRYDVATGDFSYQLADFCDDSTAENQSVMSAIGRMPIRIKQFYDGMNTSYFSLLSTLQVQVSSVVSSTGVVTIDTSLGDNEIFTGASILINYATGPKVYTIDAEVPASSSSSSSSTSSTATSYTLIEANPLEFVQAASETLPTTLQVFDTSGGDSYDQSLRDSVQAAYRRAFQNFHPTETTVDEEPSLYEFTNFLAESEAFTGFTNLDGTTAGASDLIPTYYRLWKQTGGAPVNPNGATGDLTDTNGNPIDLGKWLSLGTLHGVSSNSYGDQSMNLIGLASARSYVSNGMGEYLALIISLPEQSSTTNKVIQGFTSKRDIKKSLLDSLIGKRFIVTSRSPSSGFVVAAGNTAAYYIDLNRRSDFVFLTTVRISAKLLQESRLIIEPYIGEGMDVVTFNALDTDLDVMYRNAVDAGMISADYDYELSQTPDERVLGHATLSQVITPAFELRKVFGETNLKK